MRAGAEGLVIKTCGVGPNHFALAEDTLGEHAESTTEHHGAEGGWLVSHLPLGAAALVNVNEKSA